jgi:arylsulfatase A-like enzyme
MRFIAICLHCLDMRDFHSNLRDTPFLDELRTRSIFIPMGRGQGHHQGDSLNAEMTGRWTASFCNSVLDESGYTGPTQGRFPKTLLEYLWEAGHQLVTSIGLAHGDGSWAARPTMENLWLRDEPQRLGQFNHPKEMSSKEWLENVKASAAHDFYAHIFLRETHRPWGQEKELFSLTGPAASAGRWWRKRRGRPSFWPYDAYCARRLALEKPDQFAALRRRALARADRMVARIFEETRQLEDVVYLVYSNHGEVFDHFRYNLPFASSRVQGLRMVEGTSHGNFPYEVLYANMQMWVIPGLSARVMRGIGRSIDIPPTVLELAGIAVQGLHGESMLPHFSAGAFPDRDRYAETPNSGGCLSMVRADGLKLISMGRKGHEEDTDFAQRGFRHHALAVIDLTSDPYEYVNLIDTAQGREALAWAVRRHRELKEGLSQKP